MNLPPPVPPTALTPEPLPMYFGAEPGRLFGWLHHPPPGESSGVGLVICNPFGFEAVCAHRSLRQFALSAADAGIASLRFDYPGTGNSPGDEFEPDMLRSWVRSVRSAIDCLKQSCRVEQVVLLGVRLGATVAALSGFECGDVAGMVAVAPVLSGRVYIREMTMLGQTGTPSAVGVAAPDVADASGWPARAGSLESAGFLMTPETVEALSAVDLRKQLGRPAPRVLIVDRDDVPSAAPWLPALRAQGVDVRLEHWPGYSGMVADPQLTRVPTHMLDGVIAWLRAGAPLSAATALAATASAAIPQSVACPTGPRLLTVVPTPHGPATLCETVVTIDTGASKLFGILTECQGAAPTTAVLMLNSGAVHHIGPNRLWVRLARRWAARGVAVLRIDISGIGDSPARPGAQPNVVYSPHAVSDTEAALAFLRARCPGASCHVMGLCSGAYHSLKAAVAGQPVVSAVMINPLTYHWKEGTELGSLKDYEVIELAAKYRRKLFTGQTWRKLLRGQLDLRMIGEALLRRPGAAIAPHALELARWLRLPLRNDLATALSSTAGRGVGLRFVFGQGATGYRLLLQQGGRAVQRLLGRRQASVDFVAGADHTFTRAAARERLVARLDEIVLPPR